LEPNFDPTFLPQDEELEFFNVFCSLPPMCLSFVWPVLGGFGRMSILQFLDFFQKSKNEKSRTLRFEDRPNGCFWELSTPAKFGVPEMLMTHLIDLSSNFSKMCKSVYTPKMGHDTPDKLNYHRSQLEYLTPVQIHKDHPVRASSFSFALLSAWKGKIVDHCLSPLSCVFGMY